MTVTDSIIRNLQDLSPQQLVEVESFAVNLNAEAEAVDPERERLEDILEERDKGPFITITDMNAFRESIRARVTERVQ